MLDPAAAAALLEWYLEAGVDLAVEETAYDHLRLQEPATIVSPPVATAERSPQAAMMPPEAAAQAARSLAREAKDLDTLRALLLAFEGCALKGTATQLVFGDGDANARLMLVGEAPGRDEDLEGRPFVGRSGQLLNKMLSAIGLRRQAVYIANVVPWRPPGNRTPTPQETAICKPFIERQIALVDPDILVCLGGPSAQTLLNQRDGVLRLRGNWFDYDTGNRRIRALASLHPAYLLRQPAQKKLAWRDFRAVSAALSITPDAAGSVDPGGQ